MDAGMAQRFNNREVGVVELHVFAHEGHLHGGTGIAQLLHQRFPGGHVALMVLQAQDIEHLAAEPAFLQGDGHGIDAVRIKRGHHRSGGHAAEAADLGLEFVIDRPIAAANEDVGLDADGAQLLDGVLGWLGFQFTGGADEGQQGDVHIGQVVAAHIAAEFTDGLEVGQRFDVTDGAADLGDHHIGIAVGGHPVDALANLARDVGDHLHGAAVVITAAFFVDHRLIDRTGGHAVQA